MSLTEQEEIEYCQLLEDEDYSKCEASLSYFVRTAWNTIEPGTTYLHNWHIDLICEYLMAVYQGQIKRLVINIPFRYSKSLLASVFFPCWGWVNRPESRWIFASYAQDLSTELSVKRRRVIQSEWYQRRWGGKDTLTTDTNIKTWFANRVEGSMIASSIGGSVTGKGGNFLVCDDPLKTEEATSPVKRQFANGWFDQTFSTRLNDRKKDAIIVIMHRLHPEDLTGHILKKNLEEEFRYEVLSLPLVETQSRIITYPLSHRQTQRQEGDLLWEARDGEREIRAIREELGSSGFEAQCQQNPQIAGGNMVKREWWKYYKELPVYKMKYQSLDTAMETNQTNDYSVCITLVECENGYYLTDVWRQRVEAPDLERAVKQLYDKELPNQVLIEKKASGHGLIQHLRRETKIPIKPVEVEGDKVARLNAVLPMIEAGRVFLPEGKPWVADFIDEMSSFPNGGHDDQVDALTQLLKHVRTQQVTEVITMSKSYTTEDLVRML